MKPWAHRSELAGLLDFQQAHTGARRPVTPEYQSPSIQGPAADMGLLRHLETALQELHLLLANHEDLLQWVDHLLEYLQRLRRDFPLPAPEEAFQRLQSLRLELFWLPPTIFDRHGGDSGCIAVLSYYYATALALDPLFPEIGYAYLGSMAVTPFEKMQSLLLTRRRPQDPSTQTALSVMDIPGQVLSNYKEQQKQMSTCFDAYRSSPRSPYSTPCAQPALMPELTQTSMYTPSTTQSLRSLQPPRVSYFQGTHNRSGSGRGSPLSQPQLMNERAMGGGNPLPSQHFGYPNVSYDVYGMVSGLGYEGHYDNDLPDGMNSRFVAPSELWT